MNLETITVIIPLVIILWGFLLWLCWWMKIYQWDRHFFLFNFCLSTLDSAFEHQLAQTCTLKHLQSHTFFFYLYAGSALVSLVAFGINFLLPPQRSR